MNWNRERFALCVAAVTLLVVAMLVMQSRNNGLLPTLKTEAFQQEAWRARFESDEDPAAMLSQLPTGNAALEASLLAEALCHERSELSLAAYRMTQDRIDDWHLLQEADCYERLRLLTEHLSQADFGRQPHSSRHAIELAQRVLLSLTAYHNDTSKCQANCTLILRNASDFFETPPTPTAKHPWGDILASELDVAIQPDQEPRIPSTTSAFENEFALPGGGIPVESAFGRPTPLQPSR